jgi:hypothetical protein
MSVETTGVDGVDLFSVGAGDGDTAVVETVGVELDASGGLVTCCRVDTGKEQAWLVSDKLIKNNMVGSFLFISFYLWRRENCFTRRIAIPIPK